MEAPTICLLTNMCTAKPDIHPTDLGYRVLAGLILRQYLAGLPRFDRGRWGTSFGGCAPVGAKFLYETGSLTIKSSSK